MMRARMQETLEKAAILEKIDVLTFELFFQWAYTGVYWAPSGCEEASFDHSFCLRYGSPDCERESILFLYCTINCQEDDEADSDRPRTFHCGHCGLERYSLKGFKRCDDRMDASHRDINSKTRYTTRARKFKMIEPLQGCSNYDGHQKKLLENMLPVVSPTK
jgi:hypothetical protein